MIMCAGTALGLAILLSVSSWAVEWLLGHRIGVFLSYAMIAAVISLIGFRLFELLTPCDFSDPMRLCEGSPVYPLLLASLVLVTVPSLVLSTMVLKKWSDARAKRLA